MKKHIQVPHSNIHSLQSKGIELDDLNIYAQILKFMNSTTRTCFPSLRRIAQDTKVSVNKVRGAIKRLEGGGILKLKYIKRV